MKVPYADVRAELEGRGLVLDDEEYLSLVTYARRKAEVSGKGEDYIPLLLPDVIKEHFFRLAINAIGYSRMMEKTFA